jgi:hypothetical protein
MSKEWILNAATNRFQFNFKRNVGAVAEAIRQCQPHDLAEWESYYFTTVRSKEHIEDLGRRLYIKLSEVIQAELNSITEQDCIDYLLNLVISRTFDGYETEKATIYEQLEGLLAIKIEPAPDEWDRGFNVDFFIRINDKFIGLQIKPITFSNAQQAHLWRDVQDTSHQKFEAIHGGKVFTVLSHKQGDKKSIANPEIVEEIKKEMLKLSY